MFEWNKYLGITSGCLTVLGWLLAAGGTGHAADVCRVKENVISEECDDFFRPFWWSIFFQFFVLLAVLLILCLSHLDRTRIIVIAFLVLSTVDIMDQAESALITRDLKFPKSAINGSAAGFVMMSVANFLLIMILGFKESNDYAPPEVFSDLENRPYKPKTEISHVADYNRKNVTPLEPISHNPAIGENPRDVNPFTFN